MGKTAEELRDDIELRREYLSRDLDAIGDRVSPSRVVERRTEAVKDRFRNAKESVMGKADDIGDHAVDLRDRAGDRAGSARETVGEAAHKAQEGMHQAAEKVGEVPQMVRQQTQGNPLAAGLVAFGLGLLAATVLPESRRERRLARQVQPQLEDAARAAAQTGRAMADDLKPTIQQSAAELQDRARESVEHVKGEAQDAARSVADDSKQAASNVKDAARS
jgi:gas vesicle protein